MYILKCSDDSYYTGHTDDLEKRLAEHMNCNFDNYTSTRLPVKLVYCEAFQTRDDAFVAERKIKKWTRSKKEILINKGWTGFKEK